jgi:putative exosortase-associated protein (TIGR04073 family)
MVFSVIILATYAAGADAQALASGACELVRQMDHCEEIKFAIAFLLKHELSMNDNNSLLMETFRASCSRPAPGFVKSAIAAAISALIFGAGIPAARSDIHDPPGADYGPTRKLARGASNIVFGFTEIPHNINVGNEVYGNSGRTYGLVKGIGRAFKRLGYGVYETVTFPFPTYKGSYRIPYRQNPPWINGGMTEFSPEISFETRYNYCRYYAGY